MREQQDELQAGQGTAGLVCQNVTWSSEVRAAGQIPRQSGHGLAALRSPVGSWHVTAGTLKILIDNDFFLHRKSSDQPLGATASSKTTLNSVPHSPSSHNASSSVSNFLRPKEYSS